jgi:succinyl-CoA synthetase beta subunit
MAPLLFGYRRRPVADVTAAVEAIMALIELVMNNETIDEIEINPLMLAETGGGATAADAVIWISQS